MNRNETEIKMTSFVYLEVKLDIFNSQKNLKHTGMN